ncbi:MAG: type II toxin-antitoxin system VapC family toxin [bacterium]|nr:type II toxin-antitoxin system VapC family toxin [bacterium]
MDWPVRRKFELNGIPDDYKTDRDRPIADLAAKLRREHSWKLPDAFQAAIARHHKIKLITRNSKDFDPHKHEFVEIPYKI